MGIQINGQTDTISAIDGGLIVSGADFTGVSAGTTAAPSISPSGDSNTGIFFPSADTVCIGEGGAEVLRVNSSGNVGINSTSPARKLDVVDSGASGSVIRSRVTTNNGGYLAYEALNSSGTSVFSVTHNGRINLSDNIVFASGQGIDFSATANSSGTMTSELLSDYEEGTWTPSISGSSSGTVTTGTTVGTYTKVGRSVTLRFTFVNPSATTIGGTWRLTGLPFAIRQSTNEYIGGFVHYNRGINTAGNWLGLFQEASSAGLTYFRVVAHYMNGTETYDISGNVPLNMLFAGTVFYEAA